jgi:hypothetical protein
MEISAIIQKENSNKKGGKTKKKKLEEVNWKVAMLPRGFHVPQ